MEMCYNEALVMPKNYVSMDSNEMEYVEGGMTWQRAKDMIYGAIAAGVIALVGKSISASLVGLAIAQAGWALTAAINSTIIAFMANPILGTMVGTAVIVGVYAVGVNNGLW